MVNNLTDVLAEAQAIVELLLSDDKQHLAPRIRDWLGDYAALIGGDASRQSASAVNPFLEKVIAIEARVAELERRVGDVSD